MLNIYKPNESFYKLDCDYDILTNIANQFTFYAEGYRFQKKYKSGIWDGKIRLVNMRTAELPQGLLEKTLKYCKEVGIDITISKNVKRYSFPTKEEDILEFLATRIKKKFSLRDYQIEGIIAALKKNKAGIILPTASGKSLFQYCVFDILREIIPNPKMLLVVPTTSLVEQMAGDFSDYSTTEVESQITKIYSGTERNMDNPIFISTWQSLQNLPTSFFEQFNVLMVDEFHGSKAKELKRIVESCTNAMVKVGVSGTLEDAKVNLLQLESLFGPLMKIRDTKQLMDEGYLTKLKILPYIVNYCEDESKEFKRFTRCSKEDKQKKYHKESEFLQNSKSRLKVLSKLFKQTSGNNSLYLFKNKDYGKTLFKLAKKVCPDSRVYYVDGDTKVTDREKVRAISEKYDNVIIIASYQVFSTGINIKNLHYCVFAQPSKSKIRVLQSLGRLLRLHESKSRAILIDVIDAFTPTCFSMKHAAQRIEFYDAEGFEYKIKEINL